MLCKNVIAAGNPCKVIREINDEDTDNWNDQLNDYLENVGKSYI